MVEKKVKVVLHRRHVKLKKWMHLLQKANYNLYNADIMENYCVL